MTPAIRHTLSLALFALVALAFFSAFASVPASAQGHWDHNLGSRGTGFTGQNSPAQSQTPSMSRPSSAKPALKIKKGQRSESLSHQDVKKELSLTDDQK